MDARVKRPLGAALGCAAIFAFATASRVEAQQQLAVVRQPLAGHEVVDLGNVRVVNSGNLKYRWQRGSICFDLRDQNGHWTLEEALLVGQALDKLPDVYLQKARSGGVEKIYRDGNSPEAPWDFIAASPNASAVAVPPWPWNYMSFSNRVFVRKDNGNLNFLKIYRTVVHELGHSVQWNEAGWGIVFGTGFTWISWTGICEPFGKKSWNGFASDYALTNHREDFAVSAEWYWIDPMGLYSVNPAKYWYMRNNCFGGLVSPASARFDLEERKPVQPIIAWLGDVEDNEEDIWGIVELHGSHYMGPLDGGFNTVRYSGVRATHVPISSTEVWSWVPDMDEGWVQIKIETQDGSSNTVPLYVNEPWWHFW